MMHPCIIIDDAGFSKFERLIAKFEYNSIAYFIQ